MKVKQKLNRSQRLGLDIDKHIAIAAGAGTGKTTVMALRYIEHLLNDEQRATILLPQAPRRPLQGPGSLRAPKREQINLEQWGGLLPSECVAITFTNDAADELRHKIRKLLFEKQQDEDDPRINKKGLIEQMLSLLDEAPIGTIDSFFASLLKPWMALVNENPTKENVSDELRPLLSKLAVKNAWRIRDVKDAAESGILSNHSEFIDARNRLSTGLGGRFIAEKVLLELLNQSLFVEESESKIRHLSAGNISKDNAITNYVREMILSISEPGLKQINKIFNLANDWLQGCINFHTELELGNALSENSRYAAFDELIRMGVPSDDWEKLQWFSHFEYITTTESAFMKMKSKSSAMPYGMLPNSRNEKWPSGVLPRSVIKGKKNIEKAKIEIKDVGDKISELLSEPDFRQLRWMSYCAWLFNPVLACPKHPNGGLRGAEIASLPLEVNPPENLIISSVPLQINLLEDLFIVQRGIQSILHNIKVTREVHDYSDIQRLAEDLLLARCPDICRTWYPQKVINELDNLSENPWEDIHIVKALNLSSENNDVYQDLMYRFDVIKSLRRKFRVFIIDEYQDTNPQQFRLLSRLFGRRKLDEGELSSPASSWDPTVCVVGDLKQSIFRFRQAQVTVMLKTIQTIREINNIEMKSEERLINLRKKQGVSQGSGRDPRPIISTVKTDKFVTGDKFEGKIEGSNENILSFSLGDNDEILNSDIQLEREEGYLQLSTNYRTNGKLLLTLNEIFEDMFSEKYDFISGDWHARAQSLQPSNTLENKEGKIEWIAPILLENTNKKIEDLTIPLNPFIKSNRSKPYEREHELLAARLHSLIHGYETQILSGDEENQEWVKLPADEKVAPEDIMILVQKRTHIDDLMERLSNWGIPAIVDRQNGLLDQPIVQVLYNLLNAAINPKNPSIMASLLRSELVCFTDLQLHELIKKVKPGENIFNLLIDFVEENPNKQMYIRWAELSNSSDIITLLEETLDFSDLLTIFPLSEQRQLAEQFILIVSQIFLEVGGSGALLISTLEDLREEGGDLPAKTVPLSGAIRVMTIHAAKGLQSKVVVLCGLFNDSHHSLNNITRKRLVVTPELMASQLKPWSSKDGIESGTWQLAKLLSKSQIQAEYRRLLYVALTRVEQHLILVGSKDSAKMVGKNKIKMGLKKQENPSLGEMIFTGLAYNSKSKDSPWLIPEEKTELRLHPAELFHNSYFDKGLKSITIFHSLDCFENILSNNTPFFKAKQEQKLLESELMNLDKITDPISRKISLRLAPHKLDAAGSCKRRHWLSSNIGFASESLLPYSKEVDYFENKKFPNPADFGTLFHRLVEIGIGNPSSNNGFDLPLTWTKKQPSKLLDNEVMSEILNELLPVEADEKLTTHRLRVLAQLFEDGPLGKLCSGKVVEGLKVDGLLTEMPFECTIKLDSGNLFLDTWSPLGIRKTSDIESSSILFSGRIDLVLALSDEENKRYLMAVDLKTEGSLYGFNSSNKLDGTPLQIPSGNIEDRFELTEAEKEILHNHSLQLALYNYVLGMIQENIQDGREILPPSIYVSASGRLISWKDLEQQQQQQRLKKLLNWIVKTSTGKVDPLEIQRLPQENMSICEKCPYFSGQIKLCGPLESQIGLILNTQQNEN